MIRFLADENFNGRIVRGLWRRVPDVDLVRAQDVPAIRGADDPALLEWAEEQNRALLTHDLATMSHHAYRRLDAGRNIAGLFAVRTDLPIGAVIDDLVLIATESEPGEWRGQVRFLPL